MLTQVNKSVFMPLGESIKWWRLLCAALKMCCAPASMIFFVLESLIHILTSSGWNVPLACFLTALLNYSWRSKTLLLSGIQRCGMTLRLIFVFLLIGLFEQRVDQYLEELPDTEQSGVNKFLKGLGEFYSRGMMQVTEFSNLEVWPISKLSIMNRTFRFFFCILLYILCLCLGNVCNLKTFMVCWDVCEVGDF